MKKIFNFLFIGLLLPIYLQAQPKHEIRAVWLTSLYNLDWPATKATDTRSIRQQQRELCEILDKLEAANFNTVLFQTRLRGNVIYPSRIEAFNECLTGKPGQSPGYDPLQFVIAECHKRNMELHAWIVTIPLGTTRQNKALGSQSVVRRHPTLCKQHQGHWYMDPGHPDTRYYLSRLVMEIVNRYDIDGIHLDYIRYPEQSQKFPDNDTYRRYGKGRNKNDWRRDNITGIVRCIYENVKIKKPWVKVSTSPVGKYNSTLRYDSKGWNALHAVHQDAQLWMEEGINDILFPMMYYKDNNFFPFALDWNEHRHGRFVVPGLGVYFLDAKEGNWQLGDIMRQIRFIRNHHLDGMAFFRNKFILDDTKHVLKETTNGFFAHPAFVPAMTWMDSIAPSIPVVRPIYRDRTIMTLQWEASTNNDPTAVSYRIYASNRFPVDVSKVQNIVCTGTPDTAFQLRTDDSRSHRLYWAVTAVDRYGNESQARAFNAPAQPWQNIYTPSDLVATAGSIFVISTLDGKEVLRISSHDSDKVHTLQRGIYRLTAIHADGGQTDLGLLVK